MSSVALTDDQRAALETALSWERDALAYLGGQELRRRDAAAELEAANRCVDAAVCAAREAAMQANNVLQVLCGMLGLEPGEWRYDRATGQLTKREAPNAQSL